MDVKRLTAYLILWLLSLSATAQGVVEGRVRDSVGAPLPYVNIGVLHTTTGVVADQEGRFRLPVDRADSVTLRFSHTGYRSVDRRVKVSGVLHLDVRLRPEAQMLHEVEISDEKTRRSTFTTIDVTKLDDAVGPAAGVESLVKLLPDVQSNNELSSQYSVRGGSFDENLVYINGIEVFRPMLIRSAQQEGMSIINPDLVDYIRFSPGGFDATYGDKMSSVLDITYRPNRDRQRGKVSASLLGFTATLQGHRGDKVGYAIGLRQHSNRYLLGSLDTKGSYTTRYIDLQGLLEYHATPRLDLNLLAVATRNVYGLVPESQTTTFGGFMMPLSLRVYFDGQEQDRYHTLLGALTAVWRPLDGWRFEGSLAAQHIAETESYDVQSQYFLYELAMGEVAGDTVMFDRGVGTFLEHARNRLTTDIATLALRCRRDVPLGSWQMGVKMQLERVDDHLREWRWVDSAGFAMPTVILPLGDTTNGVLAPQLQNFASANNGLATLRAGAFAQRDVGFTTRRGADIKLVGGVRLALARVNGEAPIPMASPRLNASYKPRSEHDILFRIAAGIYPQAPFYREYRRIDGTLRTPLPPQTSYQATGGADWRFRIGQRPFALTADLYYKYITHLIPYTVDNLRLRYLPDQEAVAYAAGLSLRLGGELVDGLESWASLSLMQTQEDLEGDTLGWLARPTDQRLAFKLFLQDNLPALPWWRMSLSLVYGSGMPVGRYADGAAFRLPAYYRVDWGNTVQLARFERLQRLPLFRHIDDVQVGIEVFNLFNFRNVISYLWVSDYADHRYPVPNYLTARQVNVKLTILF